MASSKIGALSHTMMMNHNGTSSVIFSGIPAHAARETMTGVFMKGMIYFANASLGLSKT
jgi:hypothetical protein